MNMITLSKNKSRMITIFFILFSCSFSQDENEFKRLGKSGFSFLKISPSARAAGMADAFTAVAMTYLQYFLILRALPILKVLISALLIQTGLLLPNSSQA